MDKATAEGMARWVRAMARWEGDLELHTFLDQVMRQNDLLFLALASAHAVLMKHFEPETAPDDVCEVVEALTTLFEARVRAEETTDAFMRTWGRDN